MIFIKCTIINPVAAYFTRYVAILPVDLPCSGVITHSGEILTTGKCHEKKPVRLFPKNNTVTTNYTTWSLSGLGIEEAVALDKTVSENNIKISVITESKKKSQGTKETENSMVI